MVCIVPASRRFTPCCRIISDVIYFSFAYQPKKSHDQSKRLLTRFPLKKLQFEAKTGRSYFPSSVRTGNSRRCFQQFHVEKKNNYILLKNYPKIFCSKDLMRKNKKRLVEVLLGLCVLYLYDFPRPPLQVQSRL